MSTVPRIYDTFPFNDELDLLEMRLSEHWDHVDWFVLVESRFDHRMDPKPLHYLENRSRFLPWASKIRHVIQPCLNDNGPYRVGHNNTGNLLEQQRNMGAWGLYDADAHDVILVCDVDELWRREALDWIKRNPGWDFYLPKQYMSHFMWNFACVTTQDNERCHGYMAWSKGVSVGRAKSVFRFDLTWVKSAWELSAPWDRPPVVSGRAAMIHHGGWHFSWIGNWRDRLAKLDRYGHSEYDKEEIRQMLSSDDLLARKIADPASIPAIGNMFPQHRWEICELDDYFPTTMLANRVKYGLNVAKGATCRITDRLPPVGIAEVEFHLP